TQDGFNKPEIVAPGAHIVAPLANGSAFQQLCPQCIVAGQYFQISGTSMASPVVAGAAALVLQARPDLKPDQVKAVLEANGNGTADKNVELDVSRGLKTDVGAGANQGLTPNDTVYAALKEAGVDPTRATWTRATWTRATWTRATWTRATWTNTGMSTPWAR